MNSTIAFGIALVLLSLTGTALVAHASRRGRASSDRRHLRIGLSVLALVMIIAAVGVLLVLQPSDIYGGQFALLKLAVVLALAFAVAGGLTLR